MTPAIFDESHTETETSATSATTKPGSSSSTTTSTTTHPDDPHPIVSEDGDDGGSSGRHSQRHNKNRGGGARFSEEDDESESDDDEETLERQKAFRQAASSRFPGGATSESSHQHLLGATGVEIIQQRDRDGSVRASLRRFDELGDFRTRSERSRSERDASLRASSEDAGGGIDLPGPLAAVSSLFAGQLPSSNSLSGRRVQFHPPQGLQVVQEIPELDDEDARMCYMTSENWNSIDMDVELTRKRWENHKSGSIKFDKDNNCLRGLETLVMEDSEARERERTLARHQRDILEAQLELMQKNNGNGNKAKYRQEFAEKLAEVSRRTSQEQLKKARGRAIYDAEECSKLWDVELRRDSCSVSGGGSGGDDDHERFILMDIFDRYGPAGGKDGGSGGNKKGKKKKPGLFHNLSKVFGGNNGNQKKKTGPT